MRRNRLVLVHPADTVRLALFARACGWRESPRADVRPSARGWRTEAGLRVNVARDELLRASVLDLSAEDDTAQAEATALLEELPRIVGAVRHDDVLATLAATTTDTERGWALPLLAATLAEDDEVGWLRAIGAVADALVATASELRAGAVLAAAYLDDTTLLARVMLLRWADPDERVRTLARRVTAATRPYEAGGTRRVTFVADRVREEFLPFATEQGWALVDHRKGGENDSERFTWHTSSGVEAVLVADVRLEREILVLGAAKAAASGEIDRTEALVRARFSTVDLDEVLDLLARESDGARRLVLLRVAVAAAPVACQPRLLAAIVDVLASPLTPLRGFATATSSYFSWPEMVPVLGWIAEHDRDRTIRALARLVLRTVREAHGDRLTALVPTTRYYLSDGELVRRIHVVPAPLDQRLGADRLWHATSLPPALSPSYHEVSLSEAGAFAARLGAGT